MDNIANDDLDSVAKSMLINLKGEPPAPLSDSAEEADESDEQDPVDTTGAEESSSKEDSQDEAPDEEEVTEEESEEVEDVDEIEIDVVVDGETKSVKLKDLKAKYSGEMAIESRLQEVTETKAKVLNVGNVLYKTLTEQSERLRALDSILKSQAQPQINWEELRTKDPGKYLLERDKAREAEDRRRQIDEENRRINEQKSQLEALQFQEFAESQVKELTRKVPDISDPSKSKQIMEDLAEASAYYNISQEELASVVDHRHLMVLIDAAKYRKMMAEKSGKTPSNKLLQLKPRPLVKAGSSSRPTMTSNKKVELAALKRAKSTGHVDDVAKLLMVKKKG